MPHVACPICLTPPITYTGRELRQRCRCGYERQYHALGHPHGFAVVGCTAFVLGVQPGKAKKGKAPEQATLF